MDNLNLGAGEVRLTVNGDPSRVISFNPEDVLFAESFYSLIKQFEGVADTYQQRMQALEDDNEKDEYGLAKNTPQRLALVREVVENLKFELDKVFGEGTSKTLFGNACTLTMFEEFFTGILPYVQQERNKKVAKYKR